MNQIFRLVVSGLVYLILQVMLFNNLTLFERATPFVFVLFLFLLPFSIPAGWLYLIAFGVGLAVDLSTEIMPSGLHAFSAVLAMGLRNRMAMLAGAASFRSVEEIDPANQTMSWFAVFLFPLILVHHLAFFFLEAFTFEVFWLTLFKAVLSSVYTFLISIVLCFVLYKR